MELVPGGTGAAEMDPGMVEEGLDPLPGGVAPAFPTHHGPQELADHLVDGSPSPGRYGPGLAQAILFDDQGHVQPLHSVRPLVLRKRSTGSVQTVTRP